MTRKTATNLNDFGVQIKAYKSGKTVLAFFSLSLNKIFTTGPNSPGAVGKMFQNSANTGPISFNGAPDFVQGKPQNIRLCS